MFLINVNLTAHLGSAWFLLHYQIQISQGFVSMRETLCVSYYTSKRLKQILWNWIRVTICVSSFLGSRLVLGQPDSQRSQGDPAGHVGGHVSGPGQLSEGLPFHHFRHDICGTNQPAYRIQGRQVQAGLRGAGQAQTQAVRQCRPSGGALRAAVPDVL